MNLKWRVIIDDKKSAAFNMAADDVLFKRVEAGLSLPTLRFYLWNVPTFSIGYNQTIEKEIDTEKVVEAGYEYVRRQTGGRTVFHNLDLTYSICAPLTQKFAFGVTQTYAEISKALMQGLSNLGIKADFEKASLSAEHQRQIANPCFSSSSRYEISVDAKKMIGSAQLRTKQALLQHGSILWKKNQKEYAEFIAGYNQTQKQKMAGILDKKTTCINAYYNKVAFEDLVKAFLDGFKKAWNDDFFELSDYTKQELDEILEIAEKKYIKNEWNHKK